MNQEVKEKWISALESGQYDQGADVYRRPRGGNQLEYCVLGVLIDLAVKENLTTWGDGNKVIVTYRWAQLSSFDVTPLIIGNDSGTSFADLAIWIKENL